MKESLEPKKLALLRILQILEQYTCPDHPLTQDDIAARLAGDYGIELERKAIGRNLSLLKEAGYDIESDRRGSYLASREFDDSELRMLIDGVLASKYITARHSKELIEKLCALSDRHFRAHVKNIWSVNEWSKTDNCAVRSRMIWRVPRIGIPAAEVKERGRGRFKRNGLCKRKTTGGRPRCSSRQRRTR